MTTEFLTNEELHSLGTLLDTLGIPNDIAVEAPESVSTAIAGGKPYGASSMDEKRRIELVLASEPIGTVRLSHETRQLLLSRLTEIERDRRNKKSKRWSREKRRKLSGSRHWKTRLRLQKTRRGKSWSRDSLSCIIAMNKYRCKDFDREEWDREVGWVWKQYHPDDVKIRFKKGTGTKKEPWRLSVLTLTHRPTGRVLYDGNSYWLYKLSGG